MNLTFVFLYKRIQVVFRLRIVSHVFELNACVVAEVISAHVKTPMENGQKRFAPARWIWSVAPTCELGIVGIALYLNDCCVDDKSSLFREDSSCLPDLSRRACGRD